MRFVMIRSAGAKVAACRGERNCSEDQVGQVQASLRSRYQNRKDLDRLARSSEQSSSNAGTI